jgi:hypothetical protein
LISLRVPTDVSVLLTAVGVDESLQLSDRVEITSTEGTNFSVNTGSGQTHVGVEASIGPVVSVGPVALSERAHVEGDVTTASTITEQNNVTVTGTSTWGAALETSVLSWVTSFPVEHSGNYDLQPGQTAELLPGAHGHVAVKSNATLTLEGGGAFHLESLTLEPQSSLVLDESAAPVVIYVRSALTIRGGVTSTVVGGPNPLLVYVGQQTAPIEVPFSGTVVAPNAELQLTSSAGPYRGAFFARTMVVRPDVTIIGVRPGNLIPVSSGTPQECIDELRSWAVREDLTGLARERAFQRDVAFYCTAVGQGPCVAQVLGQANADYRQAALNVVGDEMSPSRYLAVSRDRTRKSRLMLDGGTGCDLIDDDADGDMVPDSRDACPGTAELVPTDDDGCEHSDYPDVDDDLVNSLIDSTHWAFDLDCIDAGVPNLPEPKGVFFFPGNPELGVRILSTRILNQPRDCNVWYEFEGRFTKPGIPDRASTVAFFKDEEIPDPDLPPAVIQFQALPTDAGSRAVWSENSPKNTWHRVRVINGAGLKSPWSEWVKVGDEHCIPGFCG